MRNYTIEEFQSLGKSGIEALPNDEFYSLALCQKYLFPDLLKITDEDTILETFYRSYNRKYVKG